MSLIFRGELHLQPVEYHQVIYRVLKTQIQFGVYRFGDRLPRIEDACQLFLVSLPTIRAAYQSLRREGLVTISKNIGVKVVVNYSGQEIEKNIQTFFALRREALTDLSRSVQLLFSHAKWACFRNAPPELFDTMEQSLRQKGVHPSYRMIQLLQQIYGVLKNDLLMRLIWQIFMFYQAPFLSVAESPDELKLDAAPLLRMTGYCREEKWDQLRAAVDSSQEKFSLALIRFYDSRIVQPSPKSQTAFLWCSYKKPSQICYSLGMELLIQISRGSYPAGTYLPPAGKLAKEKGVCVSTVRRALAVLNGIGVTKSVNGTGTQVLPVEQIGENCDLTQSAVRRRLLDFAQSLQLLALSCKEVSQVTLTSIDRSAVGQFVDRLCLLERVQRCGLAPYGILELITHLAPYQALRTVYGQLFQQLMWGYPLRSMYKEPQVRQALYRPSFERLLHCLERLDPAGFSSELEGMLLRELDCAVKLLVSLGIKEAGALSLDLTVFRG